MTTFSRLRTRVGAAVIAGACALGVTTVVGESAAQARPYTDSVYSKAMHRNIHMKVIGAGRPGAPVLYLLDGLRAPDNDNGWLVNTDVARFFAGKGVNVVIPYGGAGSFYTDWERPDPKLGVVKWDTFLTKELPGYLRGHYGANTSRNAVAGLSMSGTSALLLATKHPKMFQGVASMSGYPVTSEPGFAQGIAASVAAVGGNATNMWGIWPAGSWLANDPALHVGALRGHRVYVSAGSGGSDISPISDPVRFSQMVPLETAASIASRQYIGALQLNGINPVTNITGEGIHWWTYWQPRLHQAWFTTLKPALGL